MIAKDAWTCFHCGPDSELTGRDRTSILPRLLAVGTATPVPPTIDRSIYDARFTDREVRDLQLARVPCAS